MNWTKNQWEIMIWSDDLEFMVADNDAGARYIRMKKEMLVDKYTLSTHKFG
jgi:hypothetical protein